MTKPLMQLRTGARRLLVLALALAPALAAAQANPRFASLGIEIWPEYDRAGAVLVILKAELAPEVKLPAQVQLRLPASSGGPSAVAFASAPGGSLLNLQHERSDAGDAIALKMELPERFLHIEFYDPVATTLPARSYRYTWPGDGAVERLRVVVQEPAASGALQVEPKLELASTGRDGLRYSAADLGAREAGKPLPVVVRYTKTDLRPTAEIMKLASAPPAAAAPAAAPAAPATPAGAPFPVSVLVLLAVALLAIGATLLFVWWRRRSPAAASLPHGACTKCGAARRPGDRFCGKCGAKLA